MMKMDFMTGVGVGMAAGAMVGMMMVPKKKTMKSITGKALKAAGEIVENLTDAMN